MKYLVMVHPMEHAKTATAAAFVFDTDAEACEKMAELSAKYGDDATVIGDEREDIETLAKEYEECAETERKSGHFKSGEDYDRIAADIRNYK